MPASSVSIASPEPEKTVYIEAQQIESKKEAGMDAQGNVELQQGQQKVFIFKEKENKSIKRFSA